MNKEHVSEAVQHLIDAAPGYNGSREDQLLWWALGWDFIEKWFHQYPGIVMRLAKSLACNKTFNCPFPQMAAELLRFRTAYGLSADPAFGLHFFHDKPEGKVQPSVSSNLLIQAAYERVQAGYERRGQAICNALYSLNPQVADELRGSEADCFYRDEMILPYVQRAIGRFTKEESLRVARHINKRRLS